MKGRFSYRPKRLVIGFYCSFTNEYLGGMDSPYDPIRMLKGFYRKYVSNWKKIVAPTYRSEKMLHGKPITRIEFKY